MLQTSHSMRSYHSLLHGMTIKLQFSISPLSCQCTEEILVVCHSKLFTVAKSIILQVDSCVSWHISQDDSWSSRHIIFVYYLINVCVKVTVRHGKNMIPCESPLLQSHNQLFSWRHRYVTCTTQRPFQTIYHMLTDLDMILNWQVGRNIATEEDACIMRGHQTAFIVELFRLFPDNQLIRS